MPFTATTVNSAAAWRPDLYEFAPADALPEALILQCTTQAGSVEGDAPSVRVAFVDDIMHGLARIRTGFGRWPSESQPNYRCVNPPVLQLNSCRSVIITVIS